MKKLLLIGLMAIVSTAANAECKPNHMGGVWQGVSVSSQGYGTASCTLVVAYKKRVLTDRSNCFNISQGYPVDIQNSRVRFDNEDCIMWVDFWANGTKWESVITISNDGSTGVGYYLTSGDDGTVSIVKKFIGLIR